MTTATATKGIDRAEAVKRIKTALERRSGKKWSVTGDRGTAYGWITITAPPSRRVEHDYMSDTDRTELAKLLGLDAPCHEQGAIVAPDNRLGAVFRGRLAARWGSGRRARMKHHAEVAA